MQTLDAGVTMPTEEIAMLDGSTRTLGVAQDGFDWQAVIVYRGLHCPICNTYLAQLDALKGKFHDAGIDVIAISADPKEKAQQIVDDHNLTVPIGYDLSIAQMHTLGLYVSDPRSPQETDRPFAEPATFVINGQGELQIVDVSNAPFARPELEGLLNGIKFVRDKGYPIRGTHKPAA